MPNLDVKCPNVRRAIALLLDWTAHENLYLQPITFLTMKYVNKLENKHILVFGATSGIGFCVAEACVEFGARVTISGSNQERLDKTVQRLVESYPSSKDKIKTAVGDLSDETTVESNIKAVLEKATDGGQDKINHIAFTAGDALKIKSVFETSIEVIRKAQVVRLLGPIMIAKHIRDYIEISPDSSFTITGGVNTSKPGPGWSVQAASGGAGEGLARGLAVDLAPVRVNLVAPGAILTELWQQARFNEDFVNTMREKTLTKRLGRPEDTAEAYIYLMKDGFASGSVIATNGGYLLAN
jgi:NAD(P)-dependent dehydrogenase (short-subunit alcohol dehydrogenase family)